MCDLAFMTISYKLLTLSRLLLISQYETGVLLGRSDTINNDSHSMTQYFSRSMLNYEVLIGS
jgi:hypothetical protein